MIQRTKRLRALRRMSPLPIPNIRLPKGPLQFSLRAMLLMFVPVALLTGLAIWMLFPLSS